MRHYANGRFGTSRPKSAPRQVAAEAIAPVSKSANTRSAKTNEVRQLDDASESNPKIKAWLARHQKFRAFVENDGKVHHVPDASGERTLQQLLQLVRAELGQSNAQPISLVDFSQLRIAAVKRNTQSSTRNDLVEMVLREAIAKDVSDVYVTIHHDRCRVHFRTHGVRYLFSELAGDDGREMVRAIWALAPHGQFEQTRPTDTAFDFAGLRVRANSLPDTRGNSVVLRLRDPNWLPTLDALGYDAQQLALFDELKAFPGGLTVISGETNSGKSTTLTAMMSAMTASSMVIEVADPIEMEFEDVTHVEIDNFAEDADETFRDILGGLVRQNPDALFIGEIRDAKSAEAAVNMALQGKRVWGSIHSQSRVATLSRLQHLGIDAELLAQPGFLNGVINQSLVPVVCQSCSLTQVGDDVQTTSALRAKYRSADLRFHNPDGCPQCVRGIRGQSVVAEVMVVGGESRDDMRRHIRAGDYAAIAARLKGEKLRSKAAHAADKIRAGQLDPFLAEQVIGRIAPEDARGEDA